MNLDETKDLAQGIIQAGYDENKGEDDVKMDMFAAKIPFSKLSSLFKSISIELGHIIDPKEIKDGINELIEQVSWDAMESWSDITEAVSGIMERVNGSTEGRVLTLIRAFCKVEEIDLPKKPKGTVGGRARGGKAAAAIVSLFNDNPEPTKQDFHDAVRPCTKGDKNVLDYINMYYYVVSAVKSGTDLPSAITKLSSQADPKGNDEVVQDTAPDLEVEEAEEDMVA